MAYEVGQRVHCYYNLHKNCISVQYKGKVVGHTEDIALTDVKFVVRPAGRAKVLREKKKNVHAFVQGIVVEKLVSDHWRRVSYNPYKGDTFYLVDMDEQGIKASVETAHKAYITGKTVWVDLEGE